MDCFGWIVLKKFNAGAGPAIDATLVRIGLPMRTELPMDGSFNHFLSRSVLCQIFFNTIGSERT
jgi:hypothetical protein